MKDAMPAAAHPDTIGINGTFVIPISLERLSIVIPTLNPGPFAASIVTAMRAQGADLAKIIVIDSESTDGTVEIFRNAGCTVHSIHRQSFDHGETRNLGLRLAAGSDFVLFLTQDALPVGKDMLGHVLAHFIDPNVALVCGRQLPRDGAGPIESHARSFNYPVSTAKWAMADAERLGIKAVFNSNSCAAYRRDALLAIGGFPSRIIMGEDQAASARLLAAGWSVVYAADACVKHSHGYSMRQEFARYFDIGAFHIQQTSVLMPFGTAQMEGRRFVASEMKLLARRAPWRIPEAALRTALKLLGYRLGRKHLSLPDSWNRRLAMNKSFFASHQQQADSALVKDSSKSIKHGSS